MGRWKKGDKVKHPNLNPNILEGRSKEDIQILATRMGIGKEWREFIGDRLDS
jgi:hypothetical protein